MFCGSHLKLVDGVANDFKGMDEAESVGIKARQASGLVHQETNDKVSDEQAIDFLDDSHRFLTAQCSLSQTLMGVNLVNDDFDLPTFVVSASKVQSWIALMAEQCRNQTMRLAETRQSWILDGVS